MTRPPQSHVSDRSYLSFRERVLIVGDWLWRLLVWVWSSVIVGGVIVSVIVSYATTGTSGLTEFDPRTWYVVRPLLAHPLQTAVELIVALIVTICTYLAHLSRQKAVRKTLEGHVSKLTRQNRQRMLAKIRSFWINGVLQQSLHGAALITLGLSEQPDAIKDPWRLVFQQPDQIKRLLPPGTHITKVYDEAGGELLILGEPGSGKTTLLLELARDLLDRAERDKKHPIPVVFNLSSWVEKRQTLAEWLVEELNSKYQVPHKLGQLWMDSDQLLLLLDGLDEVSPLYRNACINAINIYRDEHGLMPTVVCSRSTDYLVQKTGLTLRSAVVVQPLTAQQIDDYLSNAGGQLASVQVALRNDRDLLELATTPLMLSVLTLAYHGKSIEDLLATNSSIEQQRQQVFETYIERSLQRRGSKSQFTQQNTVNWLAWLAKQMKQHSQTDFYIERMQPNWLLKSQWHRIYEFFAFKLPNVFIGGIVSLLIINMLFSTVFSASFELRYGIFGGLIGGLISKTELEKLSVESSRSWRNLWHNIVNLRYLRNGLIVGIVFGLSYGLSYGLMIGLFYGLSFGLSSFLLSAILERSRLTRSTAKISISSWRNFWRSLIDFGHLSVGISSGLSFGLAYVLSTELTHQLNTSQSNVLAYAMAYVLNYTLIGVLISIILKGRELEIRPAEIIVWSWRNFWWSLINIKHFRNGLLVGLLVGLIIGLSAALRVDLTFGLRFGLNAALTFGLNYWLLFGLYRGLSSDRLKEQQHVKPNQGIWRSARNSILIGFISGLVSWFICSLSYTLSFIFISGPGPALSGGLSVGKSIGLLVGLSVGLLCGLLNGGLACVQHSVLRLLLWHARFTPLNYPQFLDYSAERILLRKVGGGYIFIHRLLLEHFLSLGDSPTSLKDATQVSDVPSVSR